MHQLAQKQTVLAVTTKLSEESEKAVLNITRHTPRWD